MKLVYKIRQAFVRNPFLASIKHTIISPFLGFIYIPLGKKAIIFSPCYKLLIRSHYVGVWALLEIFRSNQYDGFLKIKEGDVVVDLGAHIGVFTIKAARETGEKGKVIAVEPEAKNLELLRENTKNYRNIIVVDKAAGERTGKTKLCISPSSVDHSINLNYYDSKTINRGEENFSEVEVDTLANILSNLGVSEVNFLKIDVEGAEKEVLRGAGEYLQKTKKVAIAAEHYPGQETELEHYLKSKGFTTKKSLIRGNWIVYGWRE